MDAAIHREVLMHKMEVPFDLRSEYGVAAALEAKRLSEKYGKDYLSCDDLVAITGLGRNNVRCLLNSEDFPTITIGNRKTVSVIAFTLWSLRSGNHNVP